MPRRSRPPDGWLTLHQIAVANGLRHYHHLVLQLCRERPRLSVRRFRGARCLRTLDLEELGRRLDERRAHRPWTRHASARLPATEEIP